MSALLKDRAGSGSTGPVLILAVLAASLLPAPAFQAGGPDRTASAGSSSANMRAAIQRAVAGQSQALHLLARCLNEGSFRSLELFASGVGIWSGDRQIQLDAAAVAGVLRQLQSSEFASMRDSYGGTPEADEISRDGALASRVTCSVQVEIDGARHASSQLWKGRQHQPLMRLARAILDLGEPFAQAGIQALSLDDALEKLLAGELRPEVIRLTANHKPAADRLGGGPAGWLLQLAGRGATLRRYRSPRGISPPQRIPLRKESWSDLIRTLKKERFASLPVNLYGAVYTDVTLQILNQRHTVQSRPFSGQRRKHLRQQKRFLHLLQKLEALIRMPAGRKPSAKSNWPGRGRRIGSGN